MLERANRGRERRAGKKAAKQAGAVQAQGGGTSRPSSRLQFSEEERATPELQKYIRKSDQRADRLDAARAAIPKPGRTARATITMWKCRTITTF